MKNSCLILFALIVMGCNPVNNHGPSPTPLPTPTATPTMILTGTLRGNVTIGPLCPVEPCDISEADRKKAYEARTILIYNHNRSVIFETINLNSTGTFEVKLAPGIYQVEQQPLGIDSSNLPVQVAIVSEQTVTIDINIDTGIR